MRWARAQRGLSPPERLVLCNLADHSNGSCKAWPAKETIQAEEGLSEATVRRALRRLEERGLVRVERPGGGFRVTTVYALALPDQDPANRRQPGHSDGLAGSNTQSNSTAIPRHPDRNTPSTSTDYPVTVTGEPVIEPVKNRYKRTAPPTPQRRAEVIRSEVLPAPAPNGAGGELAKGRGLYELITDVRDRRAGQGRPLTRGQAASARRLAADALGAGWDRDLIVAALSECSAFSRGAFDYAADQVRRQTTGEQLAVKRMSAVERSSQALRRAISGEDGKS